MENSYVLCALLGFMIGFLVVLINPIETKINTRRGFNTIQPMIKSNVNDIKSKDSFKSAETFGAKERR